MERTLARLRDVSLTDDVDGFVALLSLGLFTGLYALSVSARRRRALLLAVLPVVIALNVLRQPGSVSSRRC